MERRVSEEGEQKEQLGCVCRMEDLLPARKVRKDYSRPREQQASTGKVPEGLERLVCWRREQMERMGLPGELG